MTPEDAVCSRCSWGTLWVLYWERGMPISTSGKDIALVINYSAGKDSEAMLAMLCERYPDVQKYVVHADTGFEHVKPFTAQEWGQERVKRYGLPLNVCRNPNKTYLEMVERRHETRPDVPSWPSSSTRQCTSDLKRGPIQTWIRNHVKEKHIINCMGMRAEESPARAKLPRFKKNVALSKAGRLVYDWHPILNWTTSDVLTYLSDRAIPIHPIYVWSGGYLTRFSCRVCIFMTDSDIRAVYKHDRDAFNLVSALEDKTGYTMKSGKSLVQIVSGNDSNDPIPDRPCMSAPTHEPPTA